MNLKQLLRGGFSPRQAKTLVAQGGVPVPLSSRRMGRAEASFSPPQSIAAGTETDVNMTDGFAVVTGDDMSLPGDMLPFTLELNESGLLLLPPELEDRVYAAHVTVEATINAADAGKLPSLNVSGWISGHMRAPFLHHVGSGTATDVSASLMLIDALPRSEPTGDVMALRVDAFPLANPIVIAGVTIDFYEL